MSVKEASRYVDYTLVGLLGLAFLYFPFGQLVFGPLTDEPAMQWAFGGGGVVLGYLMIRMKSERVTSFRAEMPVIAIQCIGFGSLSFLAWEGHKIPPNSSILLFLAITFLFGCLLSVAYFVYATITMLQWQKVIEKIKET